jgi:uncharacterized membrane protein
MTDDLLEIKKKLIGKRSDRSQEFWIGIIALVFFFWTIIGAMIGIVLILWGWEEKRKIDQELAEIDFKLNKNSEKSEIYEDPIKILKLRYSKGEITKKEFEKMKENLKS